MTASDLVVLRVARTLAEHVLVDGQHGRDPFCACGHCVPEQDHEAHVSEMVARDLGAELAGWNEPALHGEYWPPAARSGWQVHGDGITALWFLRGLEHDETP